MHSNVVKTQIIPVQMVCVNHAHYWYKNHRISGRFPCSIFALITSSEIGVPKKILDYLLNIWTQTMGQRKYNTKKGAIIAHVYKDGEWCGNGGDSIKATHKTHVTFFCSFEMESFEGWNKCGNNNNTEKIGPEYLHKYGQLTECCLRFSSWSCTGNWSCDKYTLTHTHSIVCTSMHAWKGKKSSTEKRTGCMFLCMFSDKRVCKVRILHLETSTTLFMYFHVSISSQCKVVDIEISRSFIVSISSSYGNAVICIRMKAICN